VAVDSDGDALRFTVRQYGSPPSFCHRGTLTCWGFPSGLRALQETLQSRRGSAPAGSYTKRLFDDSTLLRSKLVEEAQELAEAEEPDDIASEAADLLPEITRDYPRLPEITRDYSIRLPDGAACPGTHRVASPAVATLSPPPA